MFESEFDRYLERLRERAGIRFSSEAERELRAHFDESVAAHLAAGHSQHHAELEALGELGHPEVIAAAFRRAEGGLVARFSGGPGGVLLTMGRRWRLLAVSTALAALAGSMVGRSLPPVYDVRVPLTIVAPIGFHGPPGGPPAPFRHHDSHGRFPQPGTTFVQASATDLTAALSQAEAEAQRAAAQIPGAFAVPFHRGPHGRGAPTPDQVIGPWNQDGEGQEFHGRGAPPPVQVIPGAPQVGQHSLTGQATAAGAGLGLVAGAGLALGRARKRR